MASLRILVCGMMAADPYQGGATSAVLQYLRGFQDLGHSVEFIEPVRTQDLRPPGATLAASRNARYFNAVSARYGIADRASLVLAGSRDTVGRSYEALVEAAGAADVLFNISGLLADERLLAAIPIRVYLDLDPAFNQMWHAFEGIDRRLRGHTHFVTIGQLIGRADCVVPGCGVEWIHTWQPIVLSDWPVAATLQRDAFTTVGNWRGYGSITHAGVHYGQKVHSLRPLFDLPPRTRERFELALAIHPGETRDLEQLRRHGWHLCDPAEVAGTPWDYQAFVQGSKGEFGLAKEGYVRSRCGWFSDRSIGYLASGRPVIAQETGFSALLPTGEGLFAFETADELIDAIGEINRDYPRHRAAARSLAETYFDSRTVLSRLLDRVGGS